MGSSLILTGGAAVAKTLKETVTQTGHGFTVGNAIRWDQTAATPKYVLAQADSAANAEVAGVVNTISDSNNFEVTYHGYIDLPEFSGISAPVMFLSSTVPGGLTLSPPSAVGTVVKPVLTRNTSGSGHLVMNYLGTQIGGSSTIAVDEIQPVGTIMPFAGTPIPDTWLECNGASYAVGDYPELYSKLQNSTGARAPLYGYVVTLTGTSVSSVLSVNDVIQYKASTGAWTGSGSPYATGNADALGVVISVTSTTAVVQVIPVYSNGKFTFNNVIFGSVSGGFVGTETGTGNYRAYSGGAFKAVSLTVTATTVTHFNTPDLRGRFALGINSTAFGENTNEADTAFNSALGQYGLGVLGGEEAHTLTTAEMSSHRTPLTSSNDGVYTTNGQPYLFTVNTGGSVSGIPASSFTVATTAGSHYVPQTFSKQADGTNWSFGATGGNTPHNNMPPYLAVRYIIKAKPYTRAAIVDGIDLPYNNLLIRDLRSRNVGGANGDLVFHTNTSGDSGNGTERMRLTTGGSLLFGQGQLEGGTATILFGATTGDHTVMRSVSAGMFGTNPSSLSIDGLIIEKVDLNAAVPDGGIAFTRVGSSGSRTYDLVIRNGSVGVGLTLPSATLDVNGTLNVGNFGGTTNVMAKPSGAVTGTAVGKVVPLYHYAGAPPTTFLSAGTWFVFFTAQMNGPNAPDENTVASAAFTVTVPSSQYFGLATAYGTVLRVDTAAAHKGSGIIGKFFTDTTAQSTNVAVTAYPNVPSGWSEFTEDGTAPFISKSYYNTPTTVPAASESHSMIHIRGDGTSIGYAAMLHGYAIRIA